MYYIILNISFDMEKHISKPFNDKCNYFTFQLENKLNVFLIEDPETDVACGTMLVKIGHAHDTVIGIAHFLEHMLFNGTEKYPDENEYSKYIKKNGGENNAYTSHDHTCYFFTVQPESLEHSLDMFGNFFISPLLNPDSIDREKNAVDSEHIKNITSDSWRLQEIMRKAIVDTNPLRNFGTGSARTLAIPDIDKHVKYFFENHYSSHLMTLFVITRDNVNLIKQQIIDVYSKIPHKVTPENTKYIGNKIYNYPQTIKVVPLKQMEKLVISWDLPSYKHCQLRSPYHFLSHLIGHEGKNTIHYLLCQLGYITNLYAGIEVHCNDRCTFSVSIMMTPIGSAHKEDIIYTVLKYIELIKSKIDSEHLELLYNEQMTLDAFEFKYSVKNDSMERTMEYAELVNNYEFDLHDMLIMPYAKENFVSHVKSHLNDALNDMTIEKSITMFVSNSYEGQTTLVDEDYGTCYSISNEYPDLKNATINVDLLDLPNVNRFVSISEEIITSKQKVPQQLTVECNGMDLYFLPTNEFSTPDVSIIATIDLPMSIESVESYVKTTLYFSSLLTEINYEKYMCTTANYDTHVGFDSGKLHVSMFGNYGKIKNVCEFLIGSLLNNKLITEKIFNTAVYGLTMSATNSVMQPPYKRINNFFDKKMCTKYYDNYDIIKTLNSGIITFDNVKNNIEEILATTKCTILVSGNCTQGLASDIGKIFEKFVPNQLYTMDSSSFDTYQCPQDGMEIIINDVENKLETNSAMMYNVFIEKLKYGTTMNWAKTVCLLNVLDSLISTEYFDEVRTKDTFGYVANGSKRNYGDVKNISKYYGFLVQSPHKTTKEIIDRTQRFILEYKDKLQNVTEDDLDEVIDALISSLEAPYNNLEEMANFIFGSEISANILTFDLKEKLTDELENIVLEDLIEFYNEKFINNPKVVIIGLDGNKN